MSISVVAHRGLHDDEHPENSLAAFRAAWEAGIEWCECDVRGSKDYEPFVLHDETLDRTTSGRGPISEASAESLKRLGVAPLSEVLATIAAGCKMLVEIKPSVDLIAVVNTLAICDEESCVVQSFDAGILRFAASQRRDLPLELLIEEANSPVPPGPWRAVNAEFKGLGADVVRRLRDLDLRVGAWTVNTDDDIRRVLSLEVDTIISDRPLRVRDICREIG
jgi:glycerophosphoryl diester phosphodiesterase